MEQDAVTSSSMRAVAAGAAVVVVALFLAPACGNSADRDPQAAAPSSSLTVLDGPERLRGEFLRSAGHPRLVLFLSPT